MKVWFFPVMAGLLCVSGCASNSQAPAEKAAAPAPAVKAQAAKLTPEQELSKYCRVCVVDKGEKIEEFFPSRLDTKLGGKTYKFCADSCKKSFDANPKKYALS